MITVAAGAYWKLNHPKQQVDDKVVLYGNIDLRDAQLAFVEQERITQMLVEEGDVVKTGQVLARLNHDRLAEQLIQAKAVLAAQQQTLARLQAGPRPQEIKQARAQLESADAQVRNAQQLVERLQSTAQSGASSQQTLDDAIAQLDIAKAQHKVRQEALNLALEGSRKQVIAQAQAMCDADTSAVHLLQLRLRDTVLLAPSDGVIQSRILEPGEMATPARPAYVMALTDPKWVRAYVPEPDMGRIALGLKAQIVSDTFPDKTYEGWVGFISPQAEFTPKSVQTTDLRTQLVFEVRVWVKDPENQLRQGMPVTVNVDHTQALLDVPQATTDKVEP
jgi:HlyD family secretion protein